MQGNRRKAADCINLYEEYIIARLGSIKTKEELSYLLGYYAHLITDTELQRTTRDDERVAAAWKRAKEIPELCDLADGLEEKRLEDIQSKYIKECGGKSCEQNK